MHFGPFISNCLVQLDTAPPNPHPSKAAPHFSQRVLSVSTKGFCVPLSLQRSVKTSSPSITHASVDSLLNFGKTVSCTSLYRPSSPVVTKALTLSTEMKFAGASASLPLLPSVKLTFPNLIPFYQIHDQIQHNYHVLLGHCLCLQSAARTSGSAFANRMACCMHHTTIQSCCSSSFHRDWRCLPLLTICSVHKRM